MSTKKTIDQLALARAPSQPDAPAPPACPEIESRNVEELNDNDVSLIDCTDPVTGERFQEEIVSTLEAIYKKHGDITRDCGSTSVQMKSFVLSRICKLVNNMRDKQINDIAISSLDSYYEVVMDAENMNMNVSWLRKRLDEIKNAIIISDEDEEVTKLKSEKCALLHDMLEKKEEIAEKEKAMALLESKRKDLVYMISQNYKEIEVLNKKIEVLTNLSSNCTKLSHG